MKETKTKPYVPDFRGLINSFYRNADCERREFNDGKCNWNKYNESRGLHQGQIQIDNFHFFLNFRRLGPAFSPFIKCEIKIQMTVKNLRFEAAKATIYPFHSKITYINDVWDVQLKGAVNRIINLDKELARKIKQAKQKDEYKKNEGQRYFSEQYLLNKLEQ